MEKTGTHRGKWVRTFPFLLALLLAYLAVFLVVDYIDWKKGNESYLFYFFETEKEGRFSPQEKRKLQQESATSSRLEQESIRQLRDTEKKTSLLEKESSFSGEKNKVAIIVDDMGYNLNALRDILSIKKPMTVSILPFTPYDRDIAAAAHQNGLEVMLHFPLESIGSHSKNREPGVILSRMSDEEIRKNLKRNLLRIPFIKGVNNHEGSKITSDEFFMRIILDNIKAMNLYFIDSWTTGSSKAFTLAQKMGIPTARRHVFLDSGDGEKHVKEKMIELFLLAQEKGRSVGICHPSKETLRVLRENIHLAKIYNVEFVYASQIVSKQSAVSSNQPR